MILITIRNNYGVITSIRSQVKFGRLEWVAANQFEFRLVGSFKPLEYDAARNLALQTIIDAHLPAIALKRVMRAKPSSKKTSSETKRMF